MKHLDLFSGIGGFSIASDRVWNNVEHTFVEIDPFCRAVLKKHWPEATYHENIKDFEGQPADIITGGFPCQPFSAAGKRRGKEDDRHLWPEMLRVIRASAPRWIIGENVSGLLTWNGGMVLDEVFADLEAEGYEVWAFVIPACAVGAPHRRDRVWIIAHADRDQYRGRKGSVRKKKEIPRISRKALDSRRVSGAIKIPSNSNNERLQRRGKKWVGYARQSSGNGSNKRAGWSENWLEVATELCAMDDGLPRGLVRPKGWRNAALKAAGNAIVPQVVEQIFKVIASLPTTM